MGLYLEADKKTVNPGDTISYTILYENKGIGNAKDVIITLFLDENLTFRNDNSEVSPTREGNIIRWQFETVEPRPGNMTFFVDARLNEDLDQGTIITTYAILNYKDIGGNQYEGVISNTITIEVTVALDIVYIILMLLIVAVILGYSISLISRRSKRTEETKTNLEIERIEKELELKAKRKIEPSKKARVVKKRYALKPKEKALEKIKASDMEKEPEPKAIVGAKRKRKLKVVKKGYRTKTMKESILKIKISDIEKGIGYLVMEENPAKSYNLFSELISQDHEGLCITRTFPKRVREKHELEGAKILWLSRWGDEDSILPTNLGAVLRHAKEFIEKNKNSVILLDGLEYLIVHNDFQKVLKLVHALNELAAINDARLLIPLNPFTLDEDRVALLKRDFKVLD